MPISKKCLQVSSLIDLNVTKTAIRNILALLRALPQSGQLGDQILDRGVVKDKVVGQTLVFGVQNSGSHQAVVLGQQEQGATTRYFTAQARAQGQGGFAVFAGSVYQGQTDAQGGNIKRRLRKIAKQA